MTRLWPRACGRSSQSTLTGRPRAWVEERLPSTVAAVAEVPEHLRGGWIEDILTGNCVQVLPARNVVRRLFRRS